MISQLSTEEVAECQQEYLQLWEEGGLSSLTPTDDWESRDPDTPENELEEDSPRKPGTSLAEILFSSFKKKKKIIPEFYNLTIVRGFWLDSF